MIQNVGPTDRLIRIAIAATFIDAALFGLIGTWGWIGLVPLATGLLHWCPAYLLFGANTRATGSRDSTPQSTGSLE